MPRGQQKFAFVLCDNLIAINAILIDISNFAQKSRNHRDLLANLTFIENEYSISNTRKCSLRLKTQNIKNSNEKKKGKMKGVNKIKNNSTQKRVIQENNK